LAFCLVTLPSLTPTIRQPVLRAAVARWRGPAVLLVCQADPEVVRARLAGRRGDASDADWAVYRQLAERWQEPGPATREWLEEVSTDGSPGEALTRALDRLRAEGLTERPVPRAS